MSSAVELEVEFEWNLRWNNHLNTISQLLGEFLNNKSLCDVTLSAEGQTISCHRVILAACSTYFQVSFDFTFPDGLVLISLFITGNLQPSVRQIVGRDGEGCEVY